MTRFGVFLVLLTAFTGCESMNRDDGIPRIRTQADVAEYNATVSSESEKLTCTREQVIGSNIRQLICMTVAQMERMQELGQQDAISLQRGFGGTSGGLEDIGDLLDGQ